MNKTKIYFLDDLHGVKECYSWQIDQLKKIKPQLVLLEMLPCGEKYIKLCKDLSKGLIGVYEFKEHTDWENIWGTFRGYKNLFEYLRKGHMSIYPIDHSLEERKDLVELELKIIKSIEGKKSAQDLIDKSRLKLLLEREAIFSRNIFRIIRENDFESVAFIVGGNHISRLVDFFTFLGEFEAKAKRLSKSKISELYPKFRRFHIEYAKEKGILKMEYPPLVPINVLRYSLMNKND